MAKRKQADATPATRPYKKRKAAEIAKTKLKDFTDDEDVAPDEEEQATKTRKRKPKNDKAPNLVAPSGSRIWKTVSKLASGARFTEKALYDEATQRFSQVLNVETSKDFTLTPLVLTEGPLKGRRVFLVDAVVQPFRILDLPPEIRTMIYAFLLGDKKTITMTSVKPVYDSRRAVQQGYDDHKRHPGLDWDRKTAKWIGQKPSPAALLRVSQQFLHQTAPVLYGNNSFYAFDFSSLLLFLESIGSMRQYLRHLLVGNQGYMVSKVRPVLNKLKDAADLRSFSLDHTNVCGESYRSYTGTVSPDRFVRDATPMLKAINKSQKDSDSGFTVLDIVTLSSKLCPLCDPHGQSYQADADKCFDDNRWSGCQVKCKDLAEHCQEVEAKLRKLVAKTVGMKEEETEVEEEVETSDCATQ
ncbi:hypothetical protein LTR37_002850 [Vermiconidia calcicola]|uniref:Uncharacterized protein n=1 Tax=Vermiconidia calcicola TaxID=1690605 RepID=A0ACC3NSC5_9PEZI|nr:hypothetical protein LTR37_002850 [Vermiconidia calcicola]